MESVHWLKASPDGRWSENKYKVKVRGSFSRALYKHKAVTSVLTTRTFLGILSKVLQRPSSTNGYLSSFCFKTVSFSQWGTVLTSVCLKRVLKEKAPHCWPFDICFINLKRGMI